MLFGLEDSKYDIDRRTPETRDISRQKTEEFTRSKMLLQKSDDNFLRRLSTLTVLLALVPCLKRDLTRGWNKI